MDDAIREIATAFGKAVLDRDWKAAHSLLAPWLRTTLSVDGLRWFFEGGYRRTLLANGITVRHAPEHPEPEIGGSAETTSRPRATFASRNRGTAPRCRTK